MKPWTGIALMPEADFIASALPLFEKGEIEVLEWSFDTINAHKQKTEWLSLLLNDYASKGRLLGHGVRYSLLSGKWAEEQHTWLQQLQREVATYQYRHITEHFGFMSSSNFHKGAPLPVPLTATALAIGRDRLLHLQQLAGLPVGIENLAFAFSTDQVKEQGAFLEKLIEPVNGFLILDLHNIWCQAINFDVDPQDIIASYPLEKVKEIHVSGGSWSSVSSSNKRIRRDTHDESVPEDVFDLLNYALPLCPHTEAVIFERMGHTLQEESERKHFQSDFRKIKRIVSQNTKGPEPSKIPQRVSAKPFHLPIPLQDTPLYEQQQHILRILRNAANPTEAINLLNADSSLKHNEWNTTLWKKDMIETAMALLDKWD